jgi:hypothetical protein
LSLLIPLLLAAAVGLELLTVPVTEWGERLVGTNAYICLVAIPVLAIAPLIAGLVAMRAGAPSSAMEAGAAMGLGEPEIDERPWATAVRQEGDGHPLPGGSLAPLP